MKHLGPATFLMDRSGMANTYLFDLGGRVFLVDPGMKRSSTRLPVSHTPGSYSFVLGDVAFIGDAAQSGRDGELRPMSSLLMSDVAQGDATSAMLASLPVRLFCTGHTKPVERARV